MGPGKANTKKSAKISQLLSEVTDRKIIIYRTLSSFYIRKGKG